MDEGLEELEAALRKELEDGIAFLKSHDYNPTYFQQMVRDHGAIETCRLLLAKPHPQYGLARLVELKLLPYSIEYIILKPEYEWGFEVGEKLEAVRRLRSAGMREAEVPWPAPSG